LEVEVVVEAEVHQNLLLEELVEHQNQEMEEEEVVVVDHQNLERVEVVVVVGHQN
jgi:nanoRNase/pAp phosphatase (c-di-AMP/oligoRNAs hydrolase)